ncbi:MAG: ABC transporter substrate-binding protein, partial [Chthoniobacterales bacterium]|nr:ABC transporter substrate-binding protein [Chthoniobacterales bacterium]
MPLESCPRKNAFHRRRRRFVTAGFVLALSALVALSFGSCDGAANDGKVTLRYWNGFTGPDGRTMLRLVQRFNRENPDVEVTMQRMDWGTYYNKLFVAGLGKRAPEVFVVHADNLARFTGASFVRPIDDIVGVGSIDPSDFDENVWAAVEHDGKHWGVPLDVHLIGMYYNRKLFREAGIVDAVGNPKPPATGAEFLEAVGKLTSDRNNDGKPEVWGYVFTWMRTNAYTAMRQFNGRLFTEDGTKTLINSPQNVEALQFCVDLIQKHGVAPSPENFDSWIGFRQGKVGLVFEGIYMLPELQRQTDLDFGAAPLPVYGKTPAAWGSSHTLCLRADLNEHELEASKRFIKFLSDNSLDWAEGGQIPVRKSLRESDFFKTSNKMAAQREFAKQIPYVAYLPSVPFVFEYLQAYDLAVEK